jgi:hypothetical protein
MGRAKGKVRATSAHTPGTPRRSRVPRLHVQINEEGRSVGAYEITPAIREAAANCRVAIAGETRVFTPYGQEASAVTFVEQMCALIGSPVERFGVGGTGEPCHFVGPAGDVTVSLPPMSAQAIASALEAGESLIFEGADGSALADLQALLGISLNGAAPLPLTISSLQFEVEVTPSKQALAFFPVRYLRDDARLQSASLIGGRALSVDQHFDDAFISSSAEVVMHTIAEGGIDFASYVPVEFDIDRARLTNSLHEAVAAMRGRAEILAHSKPASASAMPERMREIAGNAEELLITAETATAAALVTERIRCAARAPNSRLASDISAKEVGILVLEAALQAALGDYNASISFQRSLDYLVRAQFTGPARGFVFAESIGSDLWEDLSEIFKDIAYQCNPDLAS